MATLLALSTEYVHFKITTTEDLTGATAEVAFKASGSPVTADWKPASIVTDANGTWVRILVGSGAGGVPLAVGTYGAWVRLTDNPEIIVRNIGTLVIT